MTELLAEADAALEMEAGARRRRLRPGESADASFLGIPGARVSGTDVEVTEYPDGTVIPIIPAAGELLDLIYADVVSRIDREMLPGEMVFVRRRIGLSQEQLGKVLGVTRVTINKIENGRSPVDQRTAAAVRLLGLCALARESEPQTPGRPFPLAGLSDALSAMLETRKPRAPRRASGVRVPGTKRGQLLVALRR